MDKNNSVCVLLNWTVALLVLQVATYVPELDVNPSEVSRTTWSLAFEINNPKPIKIEVAYLTPAVGL